VTNTPSNTPPQTFTEVTVEEGFDTDFGINVNLFSSLYGTLPFDEIHICDFINCPDITTSKNNTNTLNANIYTLEGTLPTSSSQFYELYYNNGVDYVQLTYSNQVDVTLYNSPNIDFMYLISGNKIYQITSNSLSPTPSSPLYITYVDGCGSDRGYTFKNNGSISWQVSGENLSFYPGNNSPSITLTRGETYVFHICGSGHPFFIGQDRAFVEDLVPYDDGVSPQINQNWELGTFEWTIPSSAPAFDLYYTVYDFTLATTMVGYINIIN
jgi:hypothetical protein